MSEPDWLKPSPQPLASPVNNSAQAFSSPATSSSSSAPVTAAGDNTDAPPYKAVVKGFFLLVHLGLMVLMAYTGSQGIASSTGVNDTGLVFVGIYMIMFAGVLFLQEIAQIIPFAPLDNFMKKNFGFLYGNIGKGLYILFMGILAFGLTVPYELALSTAIVVSAWGGILIFVFLMAPRYFDVKEKYQP